MALRIIADLGGTRKSSFLINTVRLKDSTGVLEIRNAADNAYNDLKAANLALSATGGSGHFLKQTSAGGNFSSGVIAASDLPTSGVSANTYTYATVTVDIYGRVTSASNGSPGSFPTGVSMPFWGLAAAVPSGWLLMDGKTIGNGSSGGTARANADTQALFELLWNATTNTEFPIQTSSGGASTRGANAAADYAANKRMPLPDSRGRNVIGMDNMGGSSANRVTAAAADLMGGNGGGETHTLTLSEIPPLHPTTAGKYVLAPTGTAAIANTGVGYALSDMNAIGGGGAHNNMPPYIAANEIIKL